MTPGEFRALLGLGMSRFCLLQQQGKFLHLESVNASRACGARRYSRAKVEAWLSDELRVVKKKTA